MEAPKKLSEMIKLHRKQSGLSRLDLADLAGVGKTVVFDIENGKLTVQYNTLLKVLHALNITVTFDSPLMSSYKEFANAKS